MADIESNIRIDIDTTAALASLKNLQREISAFQTQMAKGSATTVAKARDLQQELINNINSTGKFAANLTNIRTTTESFTNALEKNKLSMGEYFRYSAAASKTFGRNFVTEFNTIEKVARERVKTLQTQYIKLGRDANGAMQAIAVRPLTLDMNNLGTQTAIAAQKQQLFNQLLKQGSTNLLNFGKNTQWAGRQLMVGFTIPLTMLGTTAAKTFMEMEQAAIKFRKVYGDLFTPTEERDQALRDIEELGQSFTQYGVAVSDTVSLAAEAAAAGFQGVDLQRQTNAAVKLSILGQLEQQKALETTISLQNAFGMSSDKLAESIDFLNAVENQTVVSLDDITTAVPKVAPVIQQLGGDVKDLSFFLAAMKEGGVNASEGANALKSGLASLINPTEKAAQMLSGLGINIKGIVQANQGDIKGIVIGFAQALDRLDPLQRAQAIEQLFGKFQFARLSTLFDNVIKQGSQAERVLDLASASAADLANMSQQELGMTSASAMNQFKKAVEDLKFALVPVGEEFLKAVTPLVQFATKVLEGFNNLDDGVKRFVVNMTGLLGVIGPVAIMTFGLLANGVANVIKTITFLRNIFQKTGQTTNVLGQTLDYMNTEQLQAAAVAASLDQAHSKLIQTFTSEAGAIDLYTVALKRAVAAQAQFTGPGIATNVRNRKPKKMQDGGVVSVPGSGKGDKVPAMLEPGEAVIPSDMVKKYGPLINGMIADNIPGYQKGKSGSGSKSRDLVHTHAQDVLDPNMFREEFATGIKSMGLDKLPKDLLEKLNVQLLGSLTAELPQWLNVKFKQAGASIEEFETTMNSVSGIFKSSARSGGFNASTAGGAQALQEFQNLVRDETIAIARQNGGKVTDPVFAQATERVIARLETQVGKPINELARVLRSRKNTPGALRASGSSAVLQQLDAEGMLRQQGQTRNYTYGDTGTMIGRKRSSGLWNASLNAFRGYSGTYFNQPYEAEITDRATFDKMKQQSQRSAKAATDAYSDQVKKGSSKKNDLYLQNRDRNSPHRLAAKDGKDDAKAYNDARTAGSGATSSRSAAARKGWETRRARQGVSPVLMPGGIAGGAEQGAKTFNAKLMSLSFALSAATGVMSMFGGTVGEIGNVLFGLSNAMFALITVTELLTKTKMGEAAMSAASARAAGVRSAMGVAEGASLFTKGGGIAGLFSNIGKGLSFALRFLGPVGIGLSALAIGIPLLVGVMENQRKKIEGLGNTANLTSDNLKKLGNIFNVQAREANFASAFASAGGTQNQRTLTQQVLESDNFATDFEEQISAVRGATVANAELALQSMSIQLAGSGFAKEQVDAIVRAIATEAGRTDLNLSFATIDLSTSQGLAQVSNTAKSAASTVAKAFEEGYKPAVEVATMYGTSMTKVGERFSDEAKAAAETAAGSFASLFEGLKTGFDGGLIDAEQFTLKLDEISTQLSQMDPNVLAKIMPTLIEKMGLTDEMAGITDLTDQLLILQAVVAGVDVGEYIEIFKAASESNDPAAQRAATRARRALTNAIDQQAKAQEELNVQEAVSTGATELQLKIDELQGQIDAYNELTASGVEAAMAYQIVGDSALYAQFTAAKSADAIAGTTANVDAFIAQVAELNKLTNQFQGLGAKISGGGAGKKSPFQEAIDQLKEQRKEIAQSISSYAKLRKAGVAIGTAFEASKDPILAAAIASTKVGTAAWNKLVKLIKQANAELEKSQLIELLREQQADLSVKLGFAKIVPQLNAMGLELEDIQDILNDPALAKAFIKDLKDGVLNSKQLLQYLEQIAALKQIEINIQLSTEQGAFDAFDGLYDKAMEMFDIQDAQVEDDFEDIIKTLEDGIAKVEDQIGDIESEIEVKQRDIEMNITRPIQNLQEQMESIQREIELEFDRPISALQEESSDLANDLAIMDKAAEAINKKYDAQAEALDKISELNQEILDQQKQQISLADALSQGDISAAAAIAQEMRASAAKASITTARDAVEAARQGEIGAIRSASGMTREEIEQRQFEISQQIYALEEQREEKQKQILAIQDQIYELEQDRKVKLDEIQVLEDKIYNIQQGQLKTLQDQLKQQQDLKQAELDKINAQREAWNDAKLAADQARIKSEEYQAVIEMTKFLVEGIKKTWDEIKSKTIELLVKEVRLPADSTTTTPAPTKPTNPTGPGNQTDPKPPTAPVTPGTWQSNRAKIKDRARVMQSALPSLYSSAGVGPLVAAYDRAYTAATNAATPQQAQALIPAAQAAYNALDKILKKNGFAGGGMVSYKRMGGLIPYKAAGGLFTSINTDSVPAMLTPGEFVMKRFAVQKYGTGMMKSINNGTYQGGTVYNSYSINVEVQTDANPDQIARAVMTQIKQIDSQRLRSTRF